MLLIKFDYLSIWHTNMTKGHDVAWHGMPHQHTFNGISMGDPIECEYKVKVPN